MKHKGILITVVLLVILLSAFGFGISYSFNHNGINRALVGQVEEDRYPDWDKWDSSMKVSELECEIIGRSGLSISKVYLIERANHYQIRFRIGCRVPFVHPELLNDAHWILEDAGGNSYTENMVVYTEQIAGRNCINVTLILDGEEFSGLSGKELNFSAVCSEERNSQDGNAPANVENGYAHCEAKFLFP